MTLLEDVEAYLENPKAKYFNDEDVAEDVKATIEEGDIYITTARWGDWMGSVLCRYSHEVQDFEYVMLQWYSYSGDSDGDQEFNAHAVNPVKVVTTKWEKV